MTEIGRRGGRLERDAKPSTVGGKQWGGVEIKIHRENNNTPYSCIFMIFKVLLQDSPLLISRLGSYEVI